MIKKTFCMCCHTADPECTCTWLIEPSILHHNTWKEGSGLYIGTTDIRQNTQDAVRHTGNRFKKNKAHHLQQKHHMS